MTRTQVLQHGMRVPYSAYSLGSTRTPSLTLNNEDQVIWIRIEKNLEKNKASKYVFSLIMSTYLYILYKYKLIHQAIPYITFDYFGGDRTVQSGWKELLSSNAFLLVKMLHLR